MFQISFGFYMNGSHFPFPNRKLLKSAIGWGNFTTLPKRSIFWKSLIRVKKIGKGKGGLCRSISAHYCRTRTEVIEHNVYVKVSMCYNVICVRESLPDIISLLRHSSKQNVEKILSVMKKWAKDNQFNL